MQSDRRQVTDAKLTPRGTERRVGPSAPAHVSFDKLRAQVPHAEGASHATTDSVDGNVSCLVATRMGVRSPAHGIGFDNSPRTDAHRRRAVHPGTSIGR